MRVIVLCKARQEKVMGGLQGNWALILVLYAALFVLAVVAHLSWMRGVVPLVWGSKRSLPSKLGLIALAAATLVVSFYAVTLLQYVRRSLPRSVLSRWAVIMPAIGLCTVLACAVSSVMRYSPQFRTLSTMLGFIPGFLAFYVVMQLVIYMAARVFRLSHRGIFATRTHLVSATVLLATGLLVG